MSKMKIILKNPNALNLIGCFKEATLAHYLSNDQLKKYSGCDFEFDINAGTGKFERLHVWTGEDHNYQEEYHEVFDVPAKFDIQLDPNGFCMNHK